MSTGDDTEQPARGEIPSFGACSPAETRFVNAVAAAVADAVDGHALFSRRYRVAGAALDALRAEPNVVLAAASPRAGAEAMSEFSVGDRVLVPGVVTIAGVSGTEVRVAGIELDVHADDLRPDTGGRDLTEHDVRDALAGWDRIVPDDIVNRLAERLNRIARGDAGTRADDEPTSFKFAIDERVQVPGGRLGTVDEQPRSGDPERVYRVLVDDADGTPACELWGVREELMTPATAGPRAVFGTPGDGQGVRLAQEYLAAAGPRAGDTAPDDERDTAEARLRIMLQAGVTSIHLMPDSVRELLAGLDRLRSDAAALRAAGDELAAAADQVTDGVLSWPHVEGSLIRAREVWRSAAGSPTTDDTGDDRG